MSLAIMQKDKTFTLDIRHHTRNSFKILDHMRTQRQLCDVTLVVKDVEIPAHKLVLVSCSPLFYSILMNTDSIEQEIIELDVNSEILLSVVDYMYTSRLRISGKNIKDILEISKTLQLHAVYEECCEVLEYVINPNNCLGIKTVAEMYGDLELLTSTSTFIDANFADVVLSEEFLGLTNTQLSQLISRDTLRISSEEKIYECIVRWINHDSKTRRKYLRFLMEYVKLPFIPKGYLKQYMANDPFLREDAHCKERILDELLHDDVITTRKIKARQYWWGAKMLLAVGGFNREASNSLEYYDFEHGNWLQILNMPPCKIWLSASIAINQTVYFMGGVRDYACSNAVSFYDTVTNSWQDIVGMSVERGGLGVATLNNCIYAVGGMDSGIILSSAEKIDLRTQKWTPIASMFTKRQNPGVSVLDGILYVVGGYDGSCDLKSAECYDENTNSWKKICDMNEHRGAVGVCTFDGKLYAIGGWNGGQCLTTVETYNPESDTWTEVTPMNVPRAWASVAVINDQIYVVGGAKSLSESLNSIDVYDKLTDSWTILPRSMNVARKCHTVVIVDRRS